MLYIDLIDVTTSKVKNLVNQKTILSNGMEYILPLYANKLEAPKIVVIYESVPRCYQY